MENKSFLLVTGLVVLALLAGGFAIVNKALDNSASATDAYGQALTNSASRGSMDLRNQLSDMIKDFTGATYSAAWDPAAMASTSEYAVGLATTSVTVTGAAVGDKVQANLATSTSSQYWTISGKVTAADTVLVTLVNYGSPSLNLGSATLTLKVTSSTPLSTSSF